MESTKNMESTINVIKEHGKYYQCNQRTWKVLSKNMESTINVIKEHGKYYQCNQRTWKVLSM